MTNYTTIYKPSKELKSYGITQVGECTLIKLTSNFGESNSDGTILFSIEIGPPCQPANYIKSPSFKAMFKQRSKLANFQPSRKNHSFSSFPTLFCRSAHEGMIARIAAYEYSVLIVGSFPHVL
jgi:hypothetical protein